MNCIFVGIVKESMDNLQTLISEENIPHRQSAGVTDVFTKSLEFNVFFRDTDNRKC